MWFLPTEPKLVPGGDEDAAFSVSATKEPADIDRKNMSEIGAKGYVICAEGEEKKKNESKWDGGASALTKLHHSEAGKAR